MLVLVWLDAGLGMFSYLLLHYFDVLFIQLVHPQDSFIIVIEITETIEICQNILIRIRTNAGKASLVLKDCQRKEKLLKSFKRSADQAKDLLLSEQTKCQQTVLRGRKFEDSFEEIIRRLPEIEAKVIRQTPVSANYMILKQQNISHQVLAS